MESCKLCNKNKRLVESHVIPKFVFKWMKATGTKYMRKPMEPNQRLQDGSKEHLLCGECEQLFSVAEKWFSENIFYSFLSNDQRIFVYEGLLGKFIVSILWRIALVSKDNIEGNNTLIRNQLELALEEWREFLFNDVKPPSYNEFHLFMIPNEWGGPQPHKYVSRYFGRDIDGHIIELGEDVWVYVKFARFMFFGRIAGTKPAFRNTQINLDRGNTMLGQFIDQPEITSYLVSRAESIYLHVEENLSEKQRNIIGDYMAKNFDEILNSDLGKRLMQDSTAEIREHGYVQSFNYLCDCCGGQLTEPNGYLLRTFEIISSAHFFKYYFDRSGLTNSEEHLQLRADHFIQLAGQDGPWVICESCLQMFDVDHKMAGGFMAEWLAAKGNYFPPKSKNFREHLTAKKLDRIIKTVITV